jgi:hypothetical protein
MYDADAAYSGILLKFTDLERADDDNSVRPEPLPVRQQLLDIGKEVFTTNTFMVHRMLWVAACHATDANFGSRRTSAPPLHGERHGSGGVARLVR